MLKILLIIHLFICISSYSSYADEQYSDDILGENSSDLKSFDEPPYFSPIMLLDFAGWASDGVDQVIVSSLDLLNAIGSNRYFHNEARETTLDGEKWVYAANDSDWARYRAYEIEDGLWVVRLENGPVDGRLSFRDNLVMTLWRDERYEWDPSVSRMREVAAVSISCIGKLPFDFFDSDIPLETIFSADDGLPSELAPKSSDGGLYTKLAAQHPEFVERMVAMLKDDDDFSIPDQSPEDEINDLLIQAIQYFEGDGVEKSNTLALECFDKAIDRGSVIAIYNKAISFIIGYGGLDKDFELAEKLLVEATEKGHQEAFHWLALIDDGTYDKWINIPPDFFAQMEIAGGETGNIGGYYEAGMKYYTGFDGTEIPDFKEAFDLFIEAASQGHHEAQFMVGNMFENGNGIIKDQKKALLWYYKAADAGNANACYYLGLIFFEGRDGKIDFVEASSWFKKAAEMGHIPSMYNYGICCHVKHSDDLLGYADETKRSLAALKWFETASSYNHLNSQILASLLYLSGDPYPINLEKALAYAMLAADQGDSSVYNQIINDDTESLIDDETIERAIQLKEEIIIR